MTKKVNSDLKGAVSLIINENLSALRDVFTNISRSVSKSASQNQGPKQDINRKTQVDVKPSKKKKKADLM